MKRLFAVVIVFFVAALMAVQAQRLDDDYVQIFNLIQEADSLSSSQPSQARARYLEAQKGLERLHNGSPDWNPTVVAFRLEYVANKLAALSSQTPAGQAGPTAAPSQPAATPTVADLESQLTSLKAQAQQLQSDRADLTAKLKEALALRPAEADPRELARAEEKVKALQKENELLKVTVENEKAKLVAPPDTKPLEAIQQSLADANRQLAQQKELNSQLALQNQTLDARMKQLSTSAPAPAAAPGAEADASRVKQLELEHDLLQAQLVKANQELEASSRKGRSRKLKELESQVAFLRARVDTLEAVKAPYSPEELALFKAPDTQLAATDAKPAQPAAQFPPGSAPLIAQAQSYFAAQQFDKAEAAYRQVLQLDQKNVPALANLAAIQVEAKQYSDAESSLKEALAVAPDDAYTLYVMGLLKFRQAKYDDAVDAFSRSAKLDPQRAEVQNYLGLALSEKGLRGPAEAALRKAIELQPNYAGAQYNLALFYVTQQPKYPALARWHYQKALNAGFPRNPDLEKMLEQKP